MSKDLLNGWTNYNDRSSVPRQSKVVYTKCHHGNEVRFGCSKCEEEKSLFFKRIAATNSNKPLETRTPIYRGCTNGQCFCTGRCKEIIGYIEN